MRQDLDQERRAAERQWARRARTDRRRDVELWPGCTGTCRDSSLPCRQSGGSSCRTGMKSRRGMKRMWLSQERCQFPKSRFWSPGPQSPITDHDLVGPGDPPQSPASPEPQVPGFLDSRSPIPSVPAPKSGVPQNPPQSRVPSYAPVPSPESPIPAFTGVKTPHLACLAASHRASESGRLWPHKRAAVEPLNPRPRGQVSTGCNRP